jgi:HD-GYP domain-containing protein (c-di-GMP phosphodiesterase class II)
MLGVLLSSLLLTLRDTILLALTDILGVLLVPILVPIVTWRDLTVPLFFLSAASTLVVVATAIRDQDLRQIAQQSRLLSENAQRYRQLWAETQERLRELQILHQASQDLNAALSLDSMLKQVTDHFLTALDMESCTIFTWDAPQNELVILFNRDPRNTAQLPPRRRLFTATLPYDSLLAPMPGTLVLRRDDPTLDAPTRWRLDQQRWRCVLAVPLLHDAEVMGLVELGDRRRDHDFRADEIRLVESLANQAAIAIEKAQLFEEEQTRRKELAALYALSRALAETQEVEDIFRLVTSHAVETVPVTFARLLILEGDEFVVRAVHPIRALDHDFELDQHKPAATLAALRRCLEQNVPLLLRAESRELNAAERESLLLHLAPTLCLVPLRADPHTLGVLLLSEARSEEREPFDTEKIRLAQNIVDQAVSALQRVQLFIELEQSYLQTVLALATAVEAKDTYTADHAQRMAALALTIGGEVGLTPRELEDLRYGAYLHDIGKIGIPDAILQKPGKLTENEWKKMRRHPEIGSQILAPILRLRGAALIVRHHHERYDGQGYPAGLAGEAIPLGARILGVVDAYIAITDRRVYKQARSHEEAIVELQRGAGSQFDPHVVETFLRLIQEGIALGERKMASSEAS